MPKNAKPKKETEMRWIVNDPEKCWNQYFDVTNIKSTPPDEKKRTCNICCVAMITGEHPDIVLKYFFDKYGSDSDRFQWQGELIGYIKRKGFKTSELFDEGIENPRFPTEKELKIMRKSIKKGNIIFYHKAGHYQLMVGYLIHNKNRIDYIFYDPAGDRKLYRFRRSRESGCRVVYPDSMIKSEKIYGMCYEVQI